MTEKFYVMEVNCETKETITREMTEEETINHLAFIEASQQAHAERIAAEEEAARIKASAIAKLTALGLTPEEAASI